MRKILWSCVVIGMISILLSFSGIFLYRDPDIKGFNLPFQFLLISLKLGSITIPKSIFSIFVNTLQIPLFDYIFSTILVLSGIGTMLVKRWGKIFAYIYAMIIILLSVIGMVMAIPNYFIVYYSEIQKQGSLAQGFAWVGAIVYVLALIGALLYPITLLIFFSRPKIKELFSAKK